MSDLNRWEGIGRLGKEIELRFLPNGEAVANFSIACDDSYKDKTSGQKVEKTEWVRCAAFGKTAEFLGEWLHKGKRVLIVGKLKTREYEKEGTKRYVTEIHVQQGTQILDWPEKDAAAGPDSARRPPQQRPAPTQSQQGTSGPDYDSFDDDIPFAPFHYLQGA